MGEIDLSNPESRKTYLKENLGNLMNGIDSNYGQVLMDELMRRMEATVSEFNEEVKAMLGQLQGKKPAPRDNILASAPPQQQPAQQAPPPPQAPPAAAQQAPPAAPKAAPAPPKTELKPPMEEPAPEPPSFDTGFQEPEVAAAPPPPEPTEKVNEVEIEVDLPEDQLSDFEKKLRSLTE